MKYSQAVLMGCIGSAVVISAMPAPSQQGSDGITMRDNDELNLVVRADIAPAGSAQGASLHAAPAHMHRHGQGEAGGRTSAHPHGHKNGQGTHGERRESAGTASHPSHEHHAASGRGSRTANGRQGSVGHSKNTIRDLHESGSARGTHSQHSGTHSSGQSGHRRESTGSQRHTSSHEVAEHSAHPHQRGASQRNSNHQRTSGTHANHGASEQRGSRRQQLRRDLYDSDMLTEREVRGSEPTEHSHSDAPHHAGKATHRSSATSPSGHRGNGGRRGTMGGTSPQRQGQHSANHHKGPRNMRNMVHSQNEPRDFDDSDLVFREVGGSTTTPHSNHAAGGTGSGRKSREMSAHGQARQPSHSRQGQGRSTKGGHKDAGRSPAGARGRRGPSNSGERSNGKHSSPHQQGEHGSAAAGHRNTDRQPSGSRRGSSRSSATPNTASNARVTRDFDEDLFVRDFDDELFVRDVLEELDAREIDELD